MFTKPLAMQFNEPVPVPVFLDPHLLEQLGRGWIIGLERICKVVEDARVFLFERDGQSQYFLFGEALEGSHGVVSPQYVDGLVYYYHSISSRLAHNFSPLPRLRGRGVGGEGGSLASTASSPQPSPPKTGEREQEWLRLRRAG